MYASRQDIIDRYGLATLPSRDDSQVDEAAVERALADASQEVDAYLASRYVLPLAAVPPVVQRLTVDIAVYRYSQPGGLLTDEKRKRYEDAVGLLDRIAKGVVSLGLPPAESPREGGGPGALVLGGAPFFTHAGLRGF